MAKLIGAGKRLNKKQMKQYSNPVIGDGGYMKPPPNRFDIRMSDLGHRLSKKMADPING